MMTEFFNCCFHCSFWPRDELSWWICHLSCLNLTRTLSLVPCRWIELLHLGSIPLLLQWLINLPFEFLLVCLLCVNAWIPFFGCVFPSTSFWQPSTDLHWQKKPLLLLQISQTSENFLHWWFWQLGKLAQSIWCCKSLDLHDSSMCYVQETEKWTTMMPARLMQVCRTNQTQSMNVALSSLHFFIW